MAARTPGISVSHSATRRISKKEGKVAGCDLSHLLRQMFVVGRACSVLYAASCVAVESGLAPLAKPEADQTVVASSVTFWGGWEGLLTGLLLPDSDHTDRHVRLYRCTPRVHWL